MWVRLPGWMIADQEPALPRPGDVVHRIGLRIVGTPRLATERDADGVSVAESVPVGAGTIRFRVCGLAAQARDVVAAGNDQSTRVGAEFVLTAAGLSVQVQFSGMASDITAGTRVTVEGEFEVVGQYEWEAFALADTRRDWFVRAVDRLNVAGADWDDAMIDLEEIR